MEQILSIFNKLKKFGFIKCYHIMVRASWIITPLLVWFVIDDFVNGIPFNNILFFLGLVPLFFLFVVTIRLEIDFYNYDNKMMKKIRSLDKLFSDLKDKDIENRFRLECAIFLKPFLYGPKLTITSFEQFLFGGGPLIAYFPNFISNFVSSYSIFFMIKENFLSILYNSNLINLYPYHYQILTHLLTNYIHWIIISIISLGILYRMSFIKYVNSKDITSKKIIYLFFEHIFNSLSAHAIIVISDIYQYPIDKMKDRHMLYYDPFIFPNSVTNIYQRAKYLLTSKNSQGTKLEYEMKSIEELKELLSFIKVSEEAPFIFKIGARLLQDEGYVVRVISQLSPHVYLGIFENECEMIGISYYDPEIGARKAHFYFEKLYVKDMFKDLAKSEVDGLKRAKHILPAMLKDIGGSKGVDRVE